MPAPTPTSGNTQGEQAAASSPNSAPSVFNKIPILNSQSRSFFLFLVCGAAIIGLVVVFFLLKGSFEPSEKKIDPNSPAATVNGEVITLGEYQELLDWQRNFYENVYLKQEGATLPEGFLETLDEFILEQMITDELLDQFAKSKGIDVTEEWIRGELEENVVKPQFNGDWTVYEKDLVEKHNGSLEMVYRSVKRDIVSRNIIKSENIVQGDFDQWVDDLKKRSQIEYKLKNDLDETSS